MKKIYQSSILTITAFCVSLITFAQKGSADAHTYINIYKQFAVSEQVRTGIPASIKLAQGILESASGNSELALNANAHFGIKCKSNWTGMTYTYDDDKKNECFRKYDSPLESYKDHSDFLKNNKRYSELFQLDMNDYAGWAHGLKKCGYATNPQYAYKLIEVIEKYELHQYTIEGITMKNAQLGSNQIIAASVSHPSNVSNLNNYTSSYNDNQSVTYYTLTSLNGLKGFYAKKDDMLLQYAIEHKIRYAKLLSLNEIEDAPLPYDMFVYIDKKRTKGIDETDVLRENETLHQFSQRNGIQLDYLLKYNHLKDFEAPVSGTVLYMQHPAPETPVIASHTAQQPTTANSSLAPTHQTKSDNGYIYKSTITGSNDSKADDRIQPTSNLNLSKSVETNPVKTTTSKETIPTVRENKTLNQPDSHNKKEEEDNINPLISKFDQSIYATSPQTSNPEVQKHFKGKNAPEQYIPEEKPKNNPAPSTKNDLNKPPKNNIDSSSGSYNTTSNFKLRNNPNELLSMHMRQVRSHNHTPYVHKATGVEHTSAPAPKKTVPKKTTTQKKTSPKKKTPTKKTSPKRR